jgi:PPK2 family polyphosphate:nucleotide phosphotransferase
VKKNWVQRLLDRYRVTDGARFRLREYGPDDTAGELVDHTMAEQLLADGITRLAALQETLFAQDRWSLLCVLQGMDTAGKDSTIKHVTTGVNPQGVHITSFREPGPEALAHDFLWRVHAAVPARGIIGIFDRSHYEDVLAVRVHPELLAAQRLPDAVRGKKFWRHRLKDIAAFEHYLMRQGIAQIKVFLHLSREEQRRRLLERLDEPDKHWKFSPSDLHERDHWDEYMAAYEAAITATASPETPWFVVPADHKWFTHLVVVEAMVDALGRLDLHLPALDAAERRTLSIARQQLEAGG